ncbi:MAG: hypothetical protein IT362_09590 [Deltaproteobacteria bacterium]|nr:hypothetical protein [Deltaproteobacteria bacterium]
MSASIVISLEGLSTRVVYGAAKGGVLTVKDALVMPTAQLEEFLDREQASEFTVVNHFSEPFQDVISVPAVKKRLLRKIVELEVRKRAGLTDFSFIHTVIGTRSTDQGKKTDVYVFAVKNEETRAIIERFSSKGKTVKALYPDAFILSAAMAVPDEDVLCVSASGDKKVFSLIKDGTLQFTREVLSNSTELNAFDIQNLDMTVNYCRQSLRVLPSVVMFAGRLGQADAAASVRGAKSACFRPQVASIMAREALSDFTAPVLALKPQAAFDISPDAYRAEKLKTTLLKYSSIAFAAMAAFLLIMTYSALRDAGAAKQELQASLAALPDIDAVVTSHESRKAEFERYVPFINILNQGASAPDPAALLSAFPGLDTSRITFSLINITPSDGALKVRLEGSIRASSYSSTQSYFEKFAASFSRIKGSQIVEQRLLIKEKTFLMEVACR